MPESVLQELRRDAVAIYEAAIAAVEPRAALRHALAMTTPPREPVWILAFGKAARPMASEAVDHLAMLEMRPAGGIVVDPSDTPEQVNGLPVVAGDHPIPEGGSQAASRALELVVRAIVPRDEVWVLLSGGTSSLIGAPVDGVSLTDFLSLHRTVARAGLPIHTLNAIRKRFARWGAGRLLKALASERIRVFAISDIPGDDPEAIGSGPCEPDPHSAEDIKAMLDACGVLSELPLSIRQHLDSAIRGDGPETPKPNDPDFGRREMRIIASNAMAVAAAAAHARALGYPATAAPSPLVGDAAAAGMELGRWLNDARAGNRPSAHVAGGETTVTLGPTHGTGGRCQELALAAAKVLTSRSRGDAVLLAAGTDGRDGPTDAAGAIVDSTTWSRAVEAGLDPDQALLEHDTYHTLDRLGALLRTGPTRTNVMDVVVGLTR